jgi:hypothetical protein
MKDVQVRLSTVIAVVAITSAGAFAAGRSTSSGSSTTVTTQATGEPPPPVAAAPQAIDDNQELPPGHPAIGDQTEDNNGLGAGHDQHGALAATNLKWTVPARWQQMPNTSSMRLATYRIPRAAGDNADGDVSVMQAGGGIGPNVDRWIGQFGPDAKATSKTTKKKVNGLDVTIVEAEGTYGGMGGKAEPNSGLLGAIVETADMPHFFKITGPKKTVQSARAELDALLASMSATNPPPNP